MLEDYFDGLYFGDVNLLANVFHPQARYVCACEGQWQYLNMADYFQRVKQRRAPASENQRRVDDIVAIDVAGPETALAKVHCAIGEKYFTDFLSLVHTEGRWQIINKLFHFSRVQSH